MKYYISFLFLFILKISFSQTVYLDQVTTVSKRTYTYRKTKDKKKLRLDFYKPKKIKGALPLLLYVHGGSFSGGKRNDKNTVRFAHDMAARGYAVASISYRLTMKKLGFGCNTSSEDKVKAFNAASEDISAAVKYLLRKKRKFRLNPRKVILVGSSAGAEAVLNLVYVQPSKTLPIGFKFAGIISMAGAITSLDQITKESAIPTQLFHGTDDLLVPYNNAPHHYCKPNSKGYLMLYGSKAIADKLKLLAQSFYLYTINKGDHSWSGKPMHLCITEIIDFLYYDVLNKKKRQTKITL